MIFYFHQLAPSIQFQNFHNITILERNKVTVPINEKKKKIVPKIWGSLHHDLISIVSLQGTYGNRLANLSPTRVITYVLCPELHPCKLGEPPVILKPYGAIVPQRPVFKNKPCFALRLSVASKEAYHSSMLRKQKPYCNQRWGSSTVIIRTRVR